MEYPFKVKPFKHQLDCWRVSKERIAFGLFMEMGCGKSAVIINNAACLWDKGALDALVVIAPNGLQWNWHDNEVPFHMPGHVKYRMAVWAADARKKEQEQMDKLFEKGAEKDLRILLVNVEAMSTKRGFDFVKKFMLGCSPMLVIDESTTIKHGKARRTKNILSLARYAKYRRILSGEPAANSPLDLYSQFEFLDPSMLGFSSFYSYRNHFADVITKRNGGRAYDQIVGYKNTDELERLIAPHSFTVKKIDCLDLPAKIYQTRKVEMSSRQAEAYKRMRDESLVEVERLLAGAPAEPPCPTELTFDELQEAGEIGPREQPGAIVTAEIVITRLLRLHQIACGFLSTDQKETIAIDEKNPRVEALIDVVSQHHAGKTIIFATYRHNIVEIEKRLAEEFGRDSVATYYGGTSDDDRRAAVKNFQDPTSPVKFFVSNKTGSYGLTLTQADLVVYYSNDYDQERRGQSEDRNHRIGQTHQSCVYVDIVASPADEKILTSLKTKKNLSQSITRSNWREWLA